MMDKNEVIVLSSDDETDTHEVEKSKPCVTIQQTSKHLVNILRKCARSPIATPQITIKRKLSTGLNSENKVALACKVRKINCSNKSKETPEVVDLVDCTDKSPNEFHQDCGRNGVIVQSQIKSSAIDNGERDVDIGNVSPEGSLNKESLDKSRKSEAPDSAKSNQENPAKKFPDGAVKVENVSEDAVPVVNESTVRDETPDENSNQNLKHFTEFVEFCGSLETIPGDRIRLTKKLMKRYGEAESSYIKSEEFRALIQKCKEKVTVHNLYLVAKDVTDELNFRKKIEVESVESSKGNKINTKICESAEDAKALEEKRNKQITKRTKFINKILKKLDKLGSKIRELEEQEVDLSDEECSSYVQLQRYRERFCQIYRRLCAFTNVIPDADRVCNRKICFTESKYPAINRCIEVWLNKTKRFPDFMDIMKLLESQSSSLGLPSNRESLRVIASDIFQQVGAMLQRRRKYDLWDSFSGFLDDQVDPAQQDPALEKLLKENFETRIKKEQEIFQYYSEMQEKERLEPEEVPEEEANHSPMESGNEDEKEIEEIENNINKRLDVAFMEDTKKMDSCEKYSDGDESERRKSGAEERHKSDSKRFTHQKESKNNFRNCKSLKWRSENSGRCKTDSADSSTGPENEEGEAEKLPKVEEPPQESPDSKESFGKSKKKHKSDSELEWFPMEKAQVDVSRKTAMGSCKAPKKWLLGDSADRKSFTSIKKSETSNLRYFPTGDGDENFKSNESFDVQYCQIMADNAFKKLGEKDKKWEKRKVFRDLTNVSRLMELNGKSGNMLELFAPSFFYPSFREFEKSSWKRRFKVSYRIANSRGEKCALSQEEKTEKNVSSNAGGESDEKNVENNSEGGGDEREGFDSGHGGESHEDGDEDKNSKNGRTGDDVSESKPEEDEEEEEEKEENEKENDFEVKSESVEHSEGSEKAKENEEVRLNEDLTSEVLEEADESEKSKNTPEEGEEKGGDEVEEESQELERIEEEEDKDVKETCELESIELSCKQDEVKETKNETIDKKLNPVVQETEPEIKTIDIIETDELNTTRRRGRPKQRSKRLGQNIMSVEISGSGMAGEEEDECRAVCRKKQNGSTSVRNTQPVRHSSRAGTNTPRSSQLQHPSEKVSRKSPASTSDEERVKRFLMHSPSSISITPPRSLVLSKPPSQAALQALETLRNLKGISATIVKGKPKKEEDVMVIGGCYKRQDEPKNSNSTKRRRSELPVISNVQSIYSTPPKIITIQGTASGFEDSSPEDETNGEKSESGPSSIRISNVWGNLPNDFMQSIQDESVTAGCSGYGARQTDCHPESVLKKRNLKKKVEYVVLE